MKAFNLLLIFILFVVGGCLPGKSSLKITSPKKETKGNLSASVSSVQIINNQLIITGTGFTDVSDVKVNGQSLNQNFSIESKSTTQIIAKSLSAISFDVSKIFNLILSNANASTTFQIDFSLCNSKLNGIGFDCNVPAGPNDVLSYVGGKWTPRSINGLTYRGTWNANDPEPSAISPGDYYIVSDAGGVFAVGDWIVWNGLDYDTIVNSVAVPTVFGRVGAIVATEGDYNLNKLFDVDLTVAPTTGKVLKYDGAKWVAGDDLSGGGAGSITTTEIANGTIVDADISAGAAIDYSKLSIPDGSIALTKLSGYVAPSTLLSTTITDGDTTHAPNVNVVFDTLETKFDKAGLPVCGAGEVLKSNGTILTCVVDSTGLSGTVAVTNGGTGATTLGLNQLLFGNGTGAIGTLATTATPSVLLSADTTGAPTWTTSTAGNFLRGSVTGVEFGPLVLGDLPAGVLSGAGTVGYVPYYSAAETLTDSPISVSGGNVGIGTSSPGSTLEVKGASVALSVIETAPTPTGEGGIFVETTGASGFLSALSDIYVGQAGWDSSLLLISENTATNGLRLHADAGKIAFSTGWSPKVDRMIIESSGNVGIKTTSPGSALDVKGTLRLSGSTSGYVGFSPAAAAGSTTYTLPVADGTNGQVLSTSGAGVLSWATVNSGAPTGAAGGDLSGTYPNPTITALDAAKVGGGGVSNAEFSYLDGVTSSIQTQLNAKQASGNYVTALTGDVTATGPGSVAATVAQVGGVTAANVATGANLANAATNLNTASTIVKRDASGNFTAGTITATLNGTATNVSGTVAVANGGTGATTLGLNQLLFGNGTGVVGTLATTATPSVLLSAVTTGAPTWTTSTAGNVLKGSVTGVQFGALTQSDLPAGSLSGAGTVNYVPYYSAASTLANSPISVSGGNVGIGTSSPGSSLDVKGSLRLSGSTSGYVGFAPSAAAGSTTYTLPTTQGTAGQVLSTNGVATTPTLSWVTPLTSVASADITNGTIIGNDMDFTGTNAWTSGIVIKDNVGKFFNFACGTTGHIATWSATGWVCQAPSGDNLGNHTAISNIRLGSYWLSSDGGNEGLAVDSTGKVGVGVAAPTAQLDVLSTQYSMYPVLRATNNGTGDSGSYVDIGNGTSNLMIGITGENAVSQGNYGQQATSFLSTASTSQGFNIIERATNRNINFFAGSTASSGNAATLTLNGTTKNVGIGISQLSSPGARLHVRGPIVSANYPFNGYFEDTTTSTYGVGGGVGFLGRTDSIATVSELGGVRGGKENSTNADVSGFVALYTRAQSSTSVTERMRVSSTGNVGIGTNSPTVKLEVSGDVLSSNLTTGGINSISVLTSQLGVSGAVSGFPNASIRNTSVSGVSGIIYNDNTNTGRAFIGHINSGVSAPYPVGTFSMMGIGTALTFGMDANEVMRVHTDGKVGIGTTSPSYTLHVNGSVAGTGAYNALSDMRLKKDIEIIPNSLEKIDALRGVSFNWRKDVHPELKLGDRGEIGVIAQEVKKVFPEAVTVDKKTGILSVAYSMLIAPLIEAVKELFHDSKIFKREIASLKSEIKELKAKNDQMAAYYCKKDPAAPFCIKK